MTLIVLDMSRWMQSFKATVFMHLHWKVKLQIVLTWNSDWNVSSEIADKCIAMKAHKCSVNVASCKQLNSTSHLTNCLTEVLSRFVWDVSQCVLLFFVLLLCCSPGYINYYWLTHFHHCSNLLWRVFFTARCVAVVGNDLMHVSD